MATNFTVEIEAVFLINCKCCLSYDRVTWHEKKHKKQSLCVIYVPNACCKVGVLTQNFCISLFAETRKGAN